MSVETPTSSSTKVAPQAVTHHSAAVTDMSTATATQKALGRRTRSSISGTTASIGRSRLSHQVTVGTSSETRRAARQSRPNAAASENAPMSTTYATLAATFASVSATVLISR